MNLTLEALDHTQHQIQSVLQFILPASNGSRRAIVTQRLRDSVTYLTTPAHCRRMKG